jgi:hypothetical protein
MSLEPPLGCEAGDPNVQAAARRTARISLAERAVLPDRAIELDSINAVVTA